MLLYLVLFCISIKYDFETYSPETTVPGNLDSTQSAVRDLLSENYFYQVEQKKDGVSLTFDYTDNHAFVVLEPDEEIQYIATTEKKGYKSLGELIYESYDLAEVPENDEYVNLIAQSIVKANPWMAEMVAPEAKFNYGDTDITHIDPALILSTDYLAGDEITPLIFLPTVNAYVDTENSSDSRIGTSKTVEFISINKDYKTLTATVEFDEEDIIAMRKNPEGIIKFVEKRLAEEYSITSMESYAGDAIWHGIALWEDNEEIVGCILPDGDAIYMSIKNGYENLYNSAIARAEAEAIEKKAEAMKLMGEASVLELILNSNVLPDIVKAYSEPLAAAYGRIENITMYGEGNTANLAKEITNNGSQVLDSLERTLGIDIKSVLAGVLGTKLMDSVKKSTEENKE